MKARLAGFFMPVMVTIVDISQSSNYSYLQASRDWRSSGETNMKNTIIALLIFAAFAWASNDDFNDYQLAHGQVQVAQK